jgi:hypothetical protein
MDMFFMLNFIHESSDSRPQWTLDCDSFTSKRFDEDCDAPSGFATKANVNVLTLGPNKGNMQDYFGCVE